MMETANPAFLALVQNAALLLSMVLMFELFLRRGWERAEPWTRVLAGLVIGAIGSALMLAPWELEPGLVFDTCSVLLAASGLFFGGLATLVAMAVTGALRIQQGGIGALTGITVILASGLLGLGLRHWMTQRGRRLSDLSPGQAYLFGLAVHVVMLVIVLLTLPSATALDALVRIGPAVLLVYPVATLVLVMLMAGHLRRRQADLQARKLQERLTYALDATRDGIWDWDIAADRVLFSPRWKTMLGYGDSDIGTESREWRERVHPEDLASVTAALDAHLDGVTGAYESEHRLRAKDGGYRWILARGRVVARDADGRALRMVGTHTDIEGRKRSEIALTSGESRLRAIFDRAGIGMAELRTADGRFIRTNQRFCDLLGYSAREMIDLDFQTITHPDDLQSDLDQMARMVAGETRGFSMEKRYCRKDGRLVWAYLTVTPLWAPGETPTHHIAVVQDIDAGKQAQEGARAAREQTKRLLDQADLGRRVLLSVIEDERGARTALAESETRLRAVFNQAAVGIARVAPDGTWLEVNAKLCEILGYGEAEMPGLCFQDVTHPDDLDSDLELVRQVLSGERQSYGMEKRYIRKSGDVVWVNLTVSLVREADGAPKYFVSVIEDIAQRKWAEQERDQLLSEIRGFNEVLEQRVTERTAELEATNQELEAFTYSVSHDLRAPLRAITGFAQILARRQRERLDDEGRHYLDNVVEAGDRMGILIEDLLAYSRTGRGAVRAQPVPLGPIMAGLTSTFGERIAEAGAEISVCEPLATPLGDPTLIGQILNNLIDNALTYRCLSGAPRITLAAQREGDRVVVSVSDNGIGIDPRYHGKVFEVFQRLHGQDEYPGTGIGLAIVTKAAHLMGGEMTLESVPGEGSRFSVRLPAAPDALYNQADDPLAPERASHE